MGKQEMLVVASNLLREIARSPMKYAQGSGKGTMDVQLPACLIDDIKEFVKYHDFV